MVGAKEGVRRQHLRLRDAMGVAKRQRQSKRACERLVKISAYLEAEVVALYRATGSELNVDSLCKDRSRRFCYPRCRGNRELDFVPVHAATRWQKGPFGIEEPLGESIAMPMIDLIVTPVVAFDERGHRLGYGQGYYDRVLAGFSGAAVGVAFAAQQARTLPELPTDVPLSHIITEEKVWDFVS